MYDLLEKMTEIVDAYVSYNISKMWESWFGLVFEG